MLDLHTERHREYVQPDTWWTMGRWCAQLMVLCGSDVMHRTELSLRTHAPRSTDEPGLRSVCRTTMNTEQRRATHKLTTNQAVQQCGRRSSEQSVAAGSTSSQR
jgi:hypothetical protein